MSSFSFDIDPYAVLGVSGDASLEQIRDAYRSKSKKFHPDVGGEDWAFRVLAQAYELLSTARVMRATRAPEAPAPAAHERPTSTQPRKDAGGESVYGGIIDKDVAPRRLIAVEHLCVRYLWDQAAYLWLNQKTSEEERFLSCSLNISWPDRGGESSQVATKDDSAILASVSEIFDHLVMSTRAVSSRCREESDGFEGWLTYSSFDRSWKAMKSLHDAVRSQGLGVRQWSRDLFVPRNWN
ncbi:J domain-containing protein [Paludisphaera borealis]|uniref:Chaperone protein DnaJ n=1 Tax=Paludisphaera borealis TaxID=1387353 RepID=A0A1U7CM77_9BACT|nr:J domain-containing protein [Paludisphaera borealis]APW59983.1 Chaperone protein DnaJ [Paludisphaera borealis]